MKRVLIALMLALFVGGALGCKDDKDGKDDKKPKKNGEKPPAEKPKE